MLADNRIALNAGWDLEMLNLELRDLSVMGADLEALGFTAQELAAALNQDDEGLVDENDVPAVAAVAVTVPGDIWCMGAHRVICGDSTDPAIVKALLGDVLPMLMVTDPPYGVEYDPGWRAKAGLNKSKSKLGKVRNDDRADWRDAWALFRGDVAYVWSAPGPLQVSSFESSVAAGFEIRQQIIWAKERFALGRGHYHYQHEPCWYAVRKTGHWVGDRSQTSLWQIKSREDDGHGHGTQKPVECMRRPMLNNSSPGQAVYDPFLGSGTTLIAARYCVAASASRANSTRSTSMSPSSAGRSSQANKRSCSRLDRHSNKWRPSAAPRRHHPKSNSMSRPEMRGRRPKPTRLKMLTGNPGKRPLNEDEPKPEATIPDCPPELSPSARKEWDRLAEELGALRMLTNLDRAALAAYCTAYAIWASEANEAIQKYGVMIKSPQGFPIQSPYLSVANRQAEIMMRIASEFGFTPASRSRIATPSAVPPPFDLFNREPARATGEHSGFFGSSGPVG